MSPEKQRIAILIAMGWKRTWSHEREVFDWDRPDGSWAISSATAIPCNSPDFLNDLNAMHEAENTLRQDQREPYYLKLTEMVHGPDWTFLLIHATAAQRAEAFLKITGKWEEEP